MIRSVMIIYKNQGHILSVKLYIQAFEVAKYLIGKFEKCFEIIHYQSNYKTNLINIVIITTSAQGQAPLSASSSISSTYYECYSLKW